MFKVQHPISGCLCAAIVYMMTITTTATTTTRDLGDIAQGCPEGTYRHDDYCYMVSSNFMTFEDAETICRAGRGLLAPVKTSQTEDFLQKLRIRKFLHRYWFGLDDRRTEGEWMHGDGTRLSGGFTRWTRGEPNNQAKTQHCANMWLERHLEWDDEDCSRKFLFACQYDEVNCTSELPRYGRSCYELSRGIATYDEADLVCHERGGMLVNIKTEGTFDFIKSIIYADRSWVNLTSSKMQYMLREQSNKASWILDTWIGIRHTSGGQWLYSDGTKVNYTNWAPGEPYSIRDAEDCVKLGLMWHDVQCDLRHGFICRYPIVEDSSPPPLTPPPNIDCVQASGHQVESPSTELEPRSESSAAMHHDATTAGQSQKSTGIHLGIAELSYAVTGCIVFGMLIATSIFLTLNWHSQCKGHPRRTLREDLQDLEVLREPENDDLA